MEGRIIISAEDENLETFVFRLWNSAKKLNRPVDGRFKMSYIGDVKPTDDPVNIIKAYRDAERFAMNQD